MSQESRKARAWREQHALTIAQLAELTGYSPLAIHFFEKGVTPERTSAKHAPHSKTAWKRFRNICAGVDAQLKSKREFKW